MLFLLTGFKSSKAKPIRAVWNTEQDSPSRSQGCEGAKEILETSGSAADAFTQLSWYQ